MEFRTRFNYFTYIIVKKSPELNIIRNNPRRRTGNKEESEPESVQNKYKEKYSNYSLCS